MFGRQGLISFAANDGCCDGTFQTPVPYNTGGGFSNSVAIADINGDGKLDLVVSDACQGGLNCSTDGAASVLLGNGDGTFQAAVTYDSGYETEAIAVADVNGDGKPDLIAANYCTALGNCATGVVSALLGNGDGTFQSAVFYGTGGVSTSSVAVADVNGDGKLDAVAGNPCASSPCSGEKARWRFLLTPP